MFVSQENDAFFPVETALCQDHTTLFLSVTNYVTLHVCSSFLVLIIGPTAGSLSATTELFRKRPEHR